MNTARKRFRLVERNGRAVFASGGWEHVENSWESNFCSGMVTTTPDARVDTTIDGGGADLGLAASRDIAVGLGTYPDFVEQLRRALAEPVVDVERRVERGEFVVPMHPASASTPESATYPATLLAYSEDQPRDEHGRWAGGGGEMPLADAIDFYRGGEELTMRAQELNYALRNGNPLTDEQKSVVAALDKGFTPAENATQVYRGFPNAADAFGTNDIASLVGTRQSDQGYQSTSEKRDVANSFAYDSAMPGDTPVAMAIDVPEGFPVLQVPDPPGDYIEGPPREVLLPRGTQVEVTGVVPVGPRSLFDVPVVQARVVADSPHSPPVTAAALLGYSDDQPRDEHGRWSPEGEAESNWNELMGLADRLTEMERAGVDKSLNNSLPAAHQPGEGEPGSRDGQSFDRNGREISKGDYVNSGDLFGTVFDPYSVSPKDGQVRVGVQPDHGGQQFLHAELITNLGPEYAWPGEDFLRRQDPALRAALGRRVRFVVEGRKVLLAYSDDQPRDDHGRWSPEGGGSGDAAGSGARALGDHLHVSDPTYPVTKMYVSDLDKVPPELLSNLKDEGLQVYMAGPKEELYQQDHLEDLRDQTPPGALGVYQSNTDVVAVTAHLSPPEDRNMGSSVSLHEVGHAFQEHYMSDSDNQQLDNWHYQLQDNLSPYEQYSPDEFLAEAFSTRWMQGFDGVAARYDSKPFAEWLDDKLIDSGAFEEPQ